jgi:hypothetical protein
MLSVDTEVIKNLAVGLGVGLGDVVGEGDVEDAGEILLYTQAMKNF